MSVNRASEVWKEIKPFAIRDMNRMLDNKAGDSGDDLYAITLYDVSAQKIKYYAVTLDGINSASAAAGSGDIVLLPACDISGLSLTVGSGVTIRGRGQSSILRGSLTNNGYLSNIQFVGNVISNSYMENCFVSVYSGNGITLTSSGSVLLNVRVANYGNGYGVYITNGLILSVIITVQSGSGYAIFVDGGQVSIANSRFGGWNGSIVNSCYLITNCQFEGVYNQGLLHQSGSGIISNCYFISQFSVGLRLSTGGLTFVDCGWAGISGEEYISFGTGDRSPKNHTHALNDLSDVVQTSVESGEILSHNGTDWINKTLTEAGISALSHTHTEIDITDLDHDAVKIDGIPVDLTGIADGEVLIYDSYGEKLVPGEGGGGASAVSDLTDVDLTGLADGDVLVYDETSGDWLPETPSSGSSLTVEEQDGTPSVSDVNKIKVTNGTLTDDGSGVVSIDFGSAATDGAAIHDNEANEISAITEKTTPANDDLLIIEDSADTYAKKKLKISNLPTGSGGTDVLMIQVFS